ncbi:hypothetical protein BEL04_10310 [Mucilaginibacter sp. PPCGB 2223]|nr:hypothetical protein BEL04_10310 [Mucilaginibacter sp. PPCGB 2223]
MNVRKIYLILTLLLSVPGITAFAQRPKPKPKAPVAAAAKEEIVITEHAADSVSIFKPGDSVRYSIDLKSTYKEPQEGKITYHIMDLKNSLIAKRSYPVTIPSQGFTQVRIAMPGQKAGFYKVNFTLNVTDDDDTVRRVFGVDTTNIRSEWKKPADFDQFWKNTKAELAKVPPEFKMTEHPEMGGGNDQVYLVEMKSLGNITVRAWLTLPKDRKPGQKFPVTVGLPGYGGEMRPFRGIFPGLAYIGLNVRGLGNSRDVIHPARDEFITYGIENKNTYIFRGVMMDCVRVIDFLFSKPELFDTKAIYASGGSMGAYLALALAGLDDRLTLISADNPGYPDLRFIDKTWDVFPINTMKDYAKHKGLNYPDFLNTWDYFDLKNFVTGIKCPTIVGIGLLDNFIPPTAEMAMYNNITAPKKIFIFPNIAHDVGPSMGRWVGSWVFTKLQIYNKWFAYNKPPEAVKVLPPPPPDPNAEVIDVKEHPANKDAIFTGNEAITYNMTLKSNFKSAQNGKLSYIVSTPEGKLVAQNSVAVSIPAKSEKTVTFDIPAQPAGFYKVNFAINTGDYDDTVRRVFGVDTNKIHTEKHKPADFDAFWTEAKRELAQVKPNFKVTEKPDLEHSDLDKVYLIEMQSLGNMTIRGYMSLPKDLRPGQRLPVSLYLPGYAAQAVPMQGTPAMALLSLSVRGQTLSDDVLKPDREEYITTGIEDKNKYILRGVLMDCVRLVDFVSSRPELDSTAIYAAGASMGGYLSMALAAIDKRVNIASANNPVFADFRSLAVTSANSFPMGEILLYNKKAGLKLDQVLNTLDYFDLKNFSDNIKVKTVVGIGLLDNMAPPTAELSMFNNIPANKKLFVFPNLAHDIGPEVGNYVGKWVYDNLKIYEKWKQWNKDAEAQKAKEEATGSNSIAVIEHPTNKEAIYKLNSSITYNVDVKNNYFKKQEGILSYYVYTNEDKFVYKDSVKVNLDSRETKKMHVEIPPQKTGFYKINFAINSDDYDDTVKRVFGVNIEAIRSTYGKPADFDDFWARTKKELAAVPPNFRMTEHKEEEKEGEQVYLIEMQSLGNLTVRAWLTLPKDRHAKEKFPVYVSMPGYGNAMVPIHGGSQFASIALNVRGHGNSRDVIHPDREDYISYSLEDKDKYIYRGAIMDGVRLMDFIYAHQELFDVSSIFVTGGSQGGYLTLCLASVDPRVSICEAENPGYIDLKVPYYTNRWPITVFHDYADAKGVKFETLMDNFEYFNLKNLVSNIKCKVVLGIGLLDPLVPPTNSLIMYNNIKTPKQLFIYPNLTHEVSPELFAYKMKWMTDNLGL